MLAVLNGLPDDAQVPAAAALGTLGGANADAISRIMGAAIAPSAVCSGTTRANCMAAVPEYKRLAEHFAGARGQLHCSAKFYWQPFLAIAKKTRSVNLPEVSTCRTNLQYKQVPPVSALPQLQRCHQLHVSSSCAWQDVPTQCTASLVLLHDMQCLVTQFTRCL